MCGITGIHHYDRGEPPSELLLARMLVAIRHRGPDDEGRYVDNGLAMGMRRLSIIDPDGGRQPIFNETGDVVVVFNGEIYNYRELATDLRRRGHVLKTASDTEVIVHLYEELGEQCVHELRGMFAFAIWDQRRQRLFIARDRLGIKPLYYAQREGCLMFASEIKALLQHPEIVACQDLTAIGSFLSLKYVPAPRTMFAGISALPPGHAMTVDRRGVSMRSYWDLSFGDSRDAHKKEEEYAEELDALLRESVKLRLRSDVPFGAFLSGGVDSSLIVALMSEFLDEPVKTFSVGFRGGGARERSDELPYARLVAERFHTEHQEIVVRPRGFVDLAEKVTWHLDQPLADQATLATYMVSELAAGHVKMVLTGEGGDELFAGYARYAGERLAALFRGVPGPVKSLALAAGARLPGMRRAKIALYALCQPDQVTRFTNWFPLFNRDMKDALLSRETKRQLNGASAEDVFGEHLAHSDAAHPLNRMLYVDTKLWLPDLLLARGDKMSMAASLEARVPLLDHKLVEFAAGLPPTLKLRGLRRKHLLKRVARRYLPSAIVDRRKRGFPIPISAWFRSEARSFVRDLLSRHAVEKRGLFNVDFVQDLIEQHESGRADHGALLWGLISLELWQRSYLDSRSYRTEPHRQAEGKCCDTCFPHSL